MTTEIDESFQSRGNSFQSHWSHSSPSQTNIKYFHPRIIKLKVKHKYKNTGTAVIGPWRGIYMLQGFYDQGW